MKRLLIHFLCGLLVFLSTSALISCGGTETGNPAPVGAGTPSPKANPAISLMVAICQKLTSCRGAPTESECHSAISASTTLGKGFGVEDQYYPTYLDVLVGADSGALQVNDEALNLCLSSIRKLECDDAHIQAVEIEDGTIKNLDQMIPTEGCPGVFSGAAPSH